MNKIFLLAFAILLASITSSARGAQPEIDDPAPQLAPHRRLVGPDLSSLSVEEIRIYKSGEISTGSLVAGGLLGTFVGLGTGHIVYGEYSTKGWIFTLGELGSLAIAEAGLTQGAVDCSLLNTQGCSGGIGLYTFGALLYTGFKVWEIIDVWTLPSRHNAEYEAIKAKVEGPRPYGTNWQLVPLFASSQTKGTAYGLGLHATF